MLRPNVVHRRLADHAEQRRGGDGLVDVDVAWVVRLILGFPVDDDDDAEFGEPGKARTNGGFRGVGAEEVSVKGMRHV